MRQIAALRRFAEIANAHLLNGGSGAARSYRFVKGWKPFFHPTPMSDSSRSRIPASPRDTFTPAPGYASIGLSGEDTRWFEDFDSRFVSFTDYAQNALGHSRASCRTYRSAFQNFRRFLIVSAQTAKGTPAAQMYAIDEWVAWNRRRGLSQVSTSTFWRSLRPFMKYLVRVQGIQNPFDGTKMPSLPKLVPKAKKASECRQILSAARNYPWRTTFQRSRAVAIFGLLIYAGLRRNEVVGLEYADVNFDTGTILVRKGKGRFGGKDRVAYMNDELRIILRDHVRERQHRGYTAPSFFISTKTAQGLSVGQMIRVVRAVRSASGVDFSIHSLRHSFVTLLLQSGVPIHVAKELAGHTTIQTTAGYLRVWDEEKRAHIQRLHLPK